MRVYTDLGLIGDAIAAIPFLDMLPGPVEFGPNFNSWVRRALPDRFRFNSGIEREKCGAVLTASDSFARCSGTNLHMAEGHFLCNWRSPPLLPYTFDFDREPGGLKPGIVIAPFSRTDDNGNKAWPLERWIELASRFDGPVYAVGSASDDFTWCVDTNLIPVAGLKLAQVLSLIESSKLLATIDTGISHLAHLGGIKHHALLYPKCLHAEFVRNPHSPHVIRNIPERVSVDEMYRLCMAAMREV